MRRIITCYLKPQEDLLVTIRRMDDDYLNLTVLEHPTYENQFELVGTREQLIKLLVDALTRVANTPGSEK